MVLQTLPQPIGRSFAFLKYKAPCEWQSNAQLNSILFLERDRKPPSCCRNTALYATLTQCTVYVALPASAQNRPQQCTVNMELALN